MGTMVNVGMAMLKVAAIVTEVVLEMTKNVAPKAALVTVDVQEHPQ